MSFDQYTRRSALTAFAAAAGSIAFPALVRAQSAPVRIATSPSDNFSEAIYAQGGGFFDNAGFTPQLISLANSGSIGSAVAGNAVDIGLANVISIANARANGLQFQIIAPSALYTAKEPSTLLIAGKTSNISTAKDLEGKSIATIELRGTMQSSIREWMAKNGADSSNVKFIETPFTTMGAMVNQGRVEAAMIGEPAYSGIRDTVRVIGNPYEAVAPEWYLNVWFATSDWLAKNRPAAHAFAAAINKAAPWCNAHRSETGALLQKSLPIPSDVLTKMVRTRFATGLSTALMQPILDTSFKYGVLKTATDANALLAHDV